MNVWFVGNNSVSQSDKHFSWKNSHFCKYWNHSSRQSQHRIFLSFIFCSLFTLQIHFNLTSSRCWFVFFNKWMNFISIGFQILFTWMRPTNWFIICGRTLHQLSRSTLEVPWHPSVFVLFCFVLFCSVCWIVWNVIWFWSVLCLFVELIWIFWFRWTLARN